MLGQACESGIGVACREWGRSLVLSQAEAPAILATKLEETTAFRAKRPRHTAMSTVKLEQLLGEKPRGWQAAVRDYVSECR